MSTIVDVKTLQLLMQVVVFLEDQTIFDIINFDDKEWNKVEDIRARVYAYFESLGFAITQSDFTGFDGVALGLPGDHYHWGEEEKKHP